MVTPSVCSNLPYPRALSPYQLGPVKLPNRILFPPFQVNYANTDGTVSDKLLAFYTSLARGGCGLVITGCATVSPDCVPDDRIMRIDDDRFLPGLQKLFAEIKSLGAVPGIQLIHHGRQARTTRPGQELWAPTAIPCPVMSQFDPQYRVKEMTASEIASVREAFIAAAERAVLAGAEVIELHAAHGYLLNQFLSPYSNQRTDAYGGAPENRARLIVEIIRGIRARLSGHPLAYALSLRVSGDEFVDDGLKPHDFQPLLPLIDEAGIDLLHVSVGVYESMLRIIPPRSLGVSPHANIASQLKQWTATPVCAVGSIPSLEAAEELIKSGQSDLIALGRAQVADPQIVAKSASGAMKDILRCVRCNSCCHFATGDPEMYCAVNPELKKRK